MKFNDNPIMVLVGLIMVSLGIGSFFGYRFFPSSENVVIAVFVLAGILFFLVLAGNIKGGVGVTFTALWLVLMGLMGQFHLDFAYSGLILSLLPLAAGAFMLIGM